jgi:hypothetical protein
MIYGRSKTVKQVWCFTPGLDQVARFYICKTIKPILFKHDDGELIPYWVDTVDAVS